MQTDAVARTEQPPEGLLALQMLHEARLPMADAARRLGLNIKSLYRYASHGVLGRSGALVKLQTLRIGGIVWTTAEALERFVVALNSDNPPPSPTVAATSRQRARQKRAAAAEAARLVGG
jgi:hypothetical protein